MRLEDEHRRPAQEPADGRPEHSVGAPTLVWVMLALVGIAVFVGLALLFGGRLG